MGTGYSRGGRATPPAHEVTPLEAAIVRFESEAQDYFKQKRAPGAETDLERETRERDLASALRHLKNERRKIQVFAQIQGRLRDYQGWGREKAEEDPLALLDESHHPTKTLAKNMRADGRPQPSNRHSPHHVVEGKGKHPRTPDTRLNLHMYGIRINDPDNGVWMPRTKADKGHWTMPNAPAHSEIHTFNYETWVNFLISPLEGETVLRSALTRIRILLRDGRQPGKVTEKKDAGWRPAP